MSLYLKYRPNDFDTIVGQEQVKDILKAEVDQDKISHSYIFFWPRWTGKTSTARIFAKAINCLSTSNKPCNECENCKLINEGKTLDFVEIDAASNTQVDKIREEIIDKAIYPPTNLRKKVYIIDEVHMLSKSAFNALLKIMEEPPEYLVFILATTEIHKVPETIISRCEVFNFKRIPLEKIVARLEYICKNENIPYTKEGLELIWKISDWWLRDAIKYLEQVSIIWEITPENVSKFLGIAPERQILDFINVVKTQNTKQILPFIDNLQQNWIDLTNFIKDVLMYLNQHLTDNLEENLQLVELFDEIYQNIKNYPSAALAYKAVLWLKFTSPQSALSNLDNPSSTNLNNTEKKSSGKTNLQKEESNQTPQPEHEKTISEQPQKNKKKSEDKNQSSTTETSKEELLKYIDSPIVKWIIKNFWHVEKVDGKIIITIISQTNYTILTQPDKLKDLENALNQIAPNTPFEVVYMPKEEYFNKKLLA